MTEKKNIYIIYGLLNIVDFSYSYCFTILFNKVGESTEAWFTLATQRHNSHADAKHNLQNIDVLCSQHNRNMK